jgi:hypothetical protein
VAPGIVSIAVSGEGHPYLGWQPHELAAALAEAVADPDARVILLEGGPRTSRRGCCWRTAARTSTDDGIREPLGSEDVLHTLPHRSAWTSPRALLDTELPVIAVAAGTRP